MPLGVPVVSFVLQGPTWVLKPGTKQRLFAPGGLMPLLADAAALEEIETLGREYVTALKYVWAKKHGRTGETEDSISGELTLPGTPGEFLTYGVTIAGNVGFVMNPLPPHVIMPKGPEALYNPFIDEGQGRGMNYYSEFGPVKAVEWVQGASSESYGPDPKWYDTIQSLADEEGLTTLNKFGAIAANIWGGQEVTTRYI